MMVKIYKNTHTLEVIIQGLEPVYPSNLQVTIIDGRVSVYNNSRKRIVFEDRWQNITDKDGNTFSTETEMQQYLSTVFENTTWRDLYGDPYFDISNDIATRLTF